MKVKINVKLLTDSPYSSSLKESFLFDDQDAVMQLTQELKIAHPTSFLVSGYRGVGKTSFINYVVENIKDDIICVNVNLSKYVDYATLVKKLIRKLHIEFENISEIEPGKEEGHEKLRADLFELYERTFNDIVNQNIIGEKTEDTLMVEAGIDLKKVVSGLLLILTSANEIFNLTSIPYIGKAAFIGSAVWATFENFNVKKVSTDTSNNSTEVSRKTLYDDEIAEHYLFKLLEGLKSGGYRVMFTFDELDKIKGAEIMDQVINDLKPLLLSGYANFFVISGQSLFYQFEKSRLEDDQIMNTLFSKTVHVPFLKYATLKKYCLNLISDEQDKRNNLVTEYFDSLILDAGRIPRKLVNLIRNTIVWEEEQAYLNIDAASEAIYKENSLILGITTDLLDNVLPTFSANKSRQDFFISQVHLWLHKIKAKETESFTISEIVKVDGYSEEAYPNDYVNKLNSICRLLFDRLVDNTLLRKDVSVDDFSGDEIILYSWIPETIHINFEDSLDLSDESDISILGTENKVFLENCIELEANFRTIYNLFYGDSGRNLSLRQMAELFARDDNHFKFNPNLKDIELAFAIRNKLVHGESLDDNEKKSIPEFDIFFSTLNNELAAIFAFEQCKKVLVGYEFLNQSINGFDFIAENSNTAIIFEVKSFNHGILNSRSIDEIINKYLNFLTTSTKEHCYYVLFYYAKTDLKTLEDFYQKLYSRVQNDHPLLINRFLVYYAQDFRSEKSSEGINVFMQELLRIVKGHL